MLFTATSWYLTAGPLSQRCYTMRCYLSALAFSFSNNHFLRSPGSRRDWWRFAFSQVPSRRGHIDRSHDLPRGRAGDSPSTNTPRHQRISISSRLIATKLFMACSFPFSRSFSFPNWLTRERIGFALAAGVCAGARLPDETRGVFAALGAGFAAAFVLFLITKGRVHVKFAARSALILMAGAAIPFLAFAIYFHQFQSWRESVRAARLRLLGSFSFAAESPKDRITAGVSDWTRPAFTWWRC